MNDFQILILGPPEIRFKGKYVDIQRRIPRALLYYLAAQGGMVGREELLPLFWENENEYYARRRLSDTLSRLRVTLPDPGCLVVNNDLVGLDPQRVFVDQVSFLELIDQAGRIPWQIPTHDLLPDHTHRFMHDAVSLWRGVHYMAGGNLPSTPALDEWLTRTTQRLELLYGRVLERLAHHARISGDLQHALELTRRALLLDELNQDLQTLSLQLLTDLDHYSEAREYYTHLEVLYKEELNSSLPAELVKLFRQIDQNHRQPSHASSQPEWKVRPTVQTPFVGRRNTIAELGQLFRKGGGAFLIGESGQGKTRLIKEFSTNLPLTTRILAATCRAAETNLPFQPLSEILRQYIRPEEWQAISPIWVRELCLLLPELYVLYPGLDRVEVETSPENSPLQMRARLLEAIRQVFLSISREHRLFLCLDDAHWSDEATLATAAYLIERPPFDRQAFFLAAARWEEENPHLQQLVANMSQANHGLVIPLSRLSDQEISELTRYVLGFPPSEHLTQILSSETGGNPFILLESLRSLLEEGNQLEYNHLTHLPLPASVQGLLATRLGKLGQLNREILEAAAILGADFNPEILSQVTQESIEQVTEAMIELERKLLIETSDSSPENIRYRFAHEKIKETLLQQTSPLRLRSLHEQTAKVLEAGPGSPVQAAVVAHHYEEAGQISLALGHWIRAAMRACQLFSFTDAQGIFAHADSLLPRSPDLSDSTIYDLYSSWFNMAYGIEDDTTLKTISHKLLGLGKERNSSLLTGCALDGLSNACLMANQFEEGLGYNRQAISYFQLNPDLFDLMEAYNHRGVLLYMLGRLDEAVEAFQAALALGADSTDLKISHSRANALYQIAMANILRGWPEKAQIHANRAQTEFTLLDNIQGQITAYNAAMMSHYYLGNYHQARTDCEHGIDLAGRSHVWRGLGYMHVYGGMIELASGNIDAAVEHEEKAIELGERYKHAEIASTGYRNIADLYYWLHDPQTSLSYCRRAVDASQEQYLGVNSRFRLGFALFQCGDRDQGRTMVEEAIQSTAKTGLGIVNIQARLCLMYIHWMAEEWELCHQLANQLYHEALQRSIPTVRIAASNILGAISLQKGDADQAFLYHQGAARISVKLPHPWLEIHSLVQLVAVAKKTSCPDPTLHPRILKKLDQLSAGVYRSPYFEAFQSYQSKIIQAIT